METTPKPHFSGCSSHFQTQKDTPYFDLCPDFPMVHSVGGFNPSTINMFVKRDHQSAGLNQKVLKSPTC
jgi:hypothetical protein